MLSNIWKSQNFCYRSKNHYDRNGNMIGNDKMKRKFKKNIRCDILIRFGIFQPNTIKWHNIMNKTNEQTFNNTSTQFVYPKSTRARIKQPKCQINRIYYHLRVYESEREKKESERKKKSRKMFHTENKQIDHVQKNRCMTCMHVEIVCAFLSIIDGSNV